MSRDYILMVSAFQTVAGHRAKMSQSQARNIFKAIVILNLRETEEWIKLTWI